MFHFKYLFTATPLDSLQLTNVGSSRSSKSMTMSAQWSTGSTSGMFISSSWNGSSLTVSGSISVSITTWSPSRSVDVDRCKYSYKTCNQRRHTCHIPSSVLRPFRPACAETSLSSVYFPAHCFMDVWTFIQKPLNTYNLLLLPVADIYHYNAQ